MTPTPTPSASDALQKARELAELHKCTTAGKWFRNAPSGLIRSDVQAKYEGDKVMTVSQGWRTLDEYDANLNMITELHNHFPSIHAELEKVTAERDELLKWYRGLRGEMEKIAECYCMEGGVIVSTEEAGIAKQALISSPEIK